jgi:protease-4
MAVLGWLGCLLCALLLVLQFAALGHYFDTTEGLTERYHSLSKTARSKVAIITVGGVIMTGEGYVQRQIDRVRQDKDVKAVVVRVNSPGGTVTGSDYILHHLNRLREERKLPVVVSMGAIAASGGYYVSMSVGDQAKSIYAEPTTTTGSIGVLIPHYDFSGLLQRFDVKDDSLATHPRKETLSLTKPMTDDQRQILTVYLNEAFQRFKVVVKSGRPGFRQDESLLDALATGEVFTGPQAKQRGLVDEIGFLEDAIGRAVELAGLTPERVRVVRFEPPLNLFSLASMQARYDAAEERFSETVELSTPRAYYLWTTIPPLLSRYSTLLVRP